MATNVRSNAYNVGKGWGESLGNTKVGKALDKAAKAVGNSFVDYGKAINKAAQQTVYGNAKEPYAVGGGAGAALVKSGAKAAVKGAGAGLLAEFGARSVSNIYNDVIKKGSK